MKEVALADRDPELAALLDDVARSGEAVLLTRNGKPVATLAPAAAESDAADRAARFVRLRAMQEELAVRHPETTAPISWEEIKAEMYPEDRYG